MSFQLLIFLYFVVVKYPKISSHNPTANYQLLLILPVFMQIEKINSISEIKPSNYPVKIAQFGTGVLVRGLIDYLIQQLNEQNGFNGSIAMIKSTSPDISEFTAQNGVYTVIASGLDSTKKKSIHPTLINCIQEIYSAENHWEYIERVFTSENLEIVVSNVTEAGLSFIDPGKEKTNNYPFNLTKLLYKRFGSHIRKQLFIIPTELIVGNGALLRTLVNRHAELLNLPKEFYTWLNESCTFCDSLVDRIVPGKWKDNEEYTLPYQDSLAISTEPYHLWAIQGGKDLVSVLNYTNSLPGLVVSEDIEPFREQKLRLLNGVHTIMTPIAYALGCKTVEEMMYHPLMYDLFITVCEKEILPTLEGISPDAPAFYNQMELRWKNPFIRHELKSILVQSLSKWPARNGQTMIRYYTKNGSLAPAMTFGLAAFLSIYRPSTLDENRFYSSDEKYPLIEFNDQKISYLFEHWSSSEHQNTPKIIDSILDDKRIIDHTFTFLPDLKRSLVHWMKKIDQEGLENSLKNLLGKI